jgi:uncharacterized 2Fe-2S/4Fe-4S cluster protein (DUF4445 family)
VLQPSGGVSGRNDCGGDYACGESPVRKEKKEKTNSSFKSHQIYERI